MSLHLEFIPQNLRANLRGYTRERKAKILAQRDAASRDKHKTSSTSLSDQKSDRGSEYDK